MTRNKKILLIVFGLSMSIVTSYSQDLPIYNHYFSNPFFYNPSFAKSKQAELNLLYRQQWTGLEGAPKFSYLTLSAPISKRMGFGLNIYNNKRGVITSSSAQVALSYKVQLGNLTSLSFGFSAGAGRNTLDMSQVDISDPTISRLLSRSFYLEGQAGINFRHQNLIVAFSMPQVFDQAIVDSNDLQKVGVNPFRATISSISYKFQLSGSLSFQPLLMYKLNKSNSQLEGYGVFQIKDAFWLGGSYRQNYSMGAVTGFRVGSIMQIGYSYEFAASQIAELNFNTHEFHVSIKLGKPSASDVKSNPNKTKSDPTQRKQAKKNARRF